MQSLRSRIPDGRECVICFEVPNAAYLISDLSVWDLIYEHCSFFTEVGLRSLFRVSGFEVTGVRTGFGGQNLTIEAFPGELPSAETDADSDADNDTLKLVSTFQVEAPRRIAAANENLVQWEQSQAKVAMWGAGARVTVFLSLVAHPQAIGRVVDINPRKHGSHLPGSGHEICAPASLEEYQPDVVLLMNPNLPGRSAARAARHEHRRGTRRSVAIKRKTIV